jgi:outer membrane protein OmpA-like peptidoglycan-associated protein
MKRLKIGLVVGVALAAAGVAGCMSTPPSPIGFNYQVDNGQANRIVQVFDLSGNTVVQIRNVDPKATRFYNAQNVEIPFKVMGENVVLSGLQQSFTVSSSRAASRVVRNAPVTGSGAPAPTYAAPVTAVPAPAAPSAAQQASDEKLLAEIGRIKAELVELKKILAAAERPSVGAQVAASPAPAPTPEAEVVRVSFADNSLYFAPPHEVRVQLVELAKAAKTVEVRGFTDSAQPTPTSEALAKGRAAAAKRFLVRNGVDGRKVRIEFEPAGKFATENLTIEGKAANRRVEIRAS